MFLTIMIGCAEKQSPKPNIFWIMADDLSWGDLGCYGQKLTKTLYNVA